MNSMSRMPGLPCRASNVALRARLGRPIGVLREASGLLPLPHRQQLFRPASSARLHARSPVLPFGRLDPAALLLPFARAARAARLLPLAVAPGPRRPPPSPSPAPPTSCPSLCAFPPSLSTLSRRRSRRRSWSDRDRSALLFPSAYRSLPLPPPPPLSASFVGPSLFIPRRPLDLRFPEVVVVVVDFPCSVLDLPIQILPISARSSLRFPEVVVVLDFSCSVLDLVVQILPISAQSSMRFPEVAWIGIVLLAWPHFYQMHERCTFELDYLSGNAYRSLCATSPLQFLGHIAAARAGDRRRMLICLTED